MSALCNENQGTVSLVLTWILLSLATITVVLRLYVKLDLHYNVGWDDYAALASMVGCLSNSGDYSVDVDCGQASWSCSRRLLHQNDCIRNG